MAGLFISPFAPAFALNGIIAPAATLTFYATGTSTPANVYADSGLITSLGSVVTANAQGQFVAIYLSPKQVYRVVLKTSSGSVLGDIDPVTESTLAQLAASTGASLVGVVQAGTGAVARTVQDKSRETVTAEDFGAVADGVTDDQPAIQAAITYLTSLGGGTVLLTKAGTYRTFRPIEMANNVILMGKQQGTTIKNNGAIVSAVTSVRCVISAGTKKFWGLHNLTLIGDRVKTLGVVTGSNFGVYAEFSGYFEMSNLRADYCIEGYKFNQCIAFGVTQVMALRCSNYGFRLYNTCTSFRLKGCYSWATGGGFTLTSCLYGSIDTPFVENSDNGNLPGGADVDPFGDSGGDCYNPVFMYELIGAQGITISSAGGESNCSNWLYCEGSQVTFNSPHLYNTKAFNTTWKLIQLRGTSYSNARIINPYGFNDITLRLAATQAIYIEDPIKQKLQITGRWRPSTMTGHASVSIDGVLDGSSRALVNFTQSSMIVGGLLPFIKSNAGDTAEILYTSGVKRVHLLAGVSANGRFSIPLDVTEGYFRLKANGFASSLSNVARFTIAQYTSVGVLVGDLYTFSATGGGTPVIGEWAFAAADAGNNLRLDMAALSATEDFQYTTLILDHISGQGA